MFVFKLTFFLKTAHPPISFHNHKVDSEIKIIHIFLRHILKQSPYLNIQAMNINTSTPASQLYLSVLQVFQHGVNGWVRSVITHLQRAQRGSRLIKVTLINFSWKKIREVTDRRIKYCLTS